MTTIEERADKVIYEPKDGHTPLKACEVIACAWGYEKGATEQKAIDDAELHQRFEKVLNGQKWDLIDKACGCYCDNICEIGRSGMCNHKYDGKGQIKSAFKYNECNELQLIHRMMEE